MWWLFGKKGATKFSGCSTAEEVTQGIDGSSLTAVVTGATAGIGTETARVLALRGVHVIIGARNTVAAEEVKAGMVKEIPSAKVDVMELDLSSMASVRNFASNFISSGLPLNILINNAAVHSGKFMLSKDNIELTFATNHLGHLLLTNLLLETMKETSNKSGREGRIINVSSGGHQTPYRGGIQFDNINDPSGFHAFLAYCQSKLAMILHANELARRLKEEGANLTANSLHPGIILTNLIFKKGAYYGTTVIGGLLRTICRGVIKDVQQGAATTCYVALHPKVEGISGEYFVNSSIGEASSLARDMNLAKKLWDFSMDLVSR